MEAGNSECGTVRATGDGPGGKRGTAGAGIRGGLVAPKRTEGLALGAREARRVSAVPGEGVRPERRCEAPPVVGTAR